MIIFVFRLRYKSMKKEYITIPNIITSIRLIGALILIFLKPLSTPYIVVYSISGLSDAIDGFVARKMHSVSEFGSKLDSVADLSFFTVMMLKILPTLVKKLPKSIWHYVTIIVAFRICIYLINAFLRKNLLSSHSYLNKASGLMLFVLPYLIGTSYLEPYSWMLVGVTGLAAVYEFTYSIVKTK